MKLDKNDSLRLRRGVGYEMAETEYLRSFLKPGGFFVDVGAHIGYHTINAAATVGPSGLVMAFEPERENFEVLKENTAPYPQVKIHNVAVGEKAGETYVYLNPTNSGDHRVFASPKRVAQGPVPQVTIDEAVAHCGPPNFIKIDTQGYELACLRGAAATIQRSPQMEILVEYYPLGIKAAGFKEQDFFDALAGYGLSLFRMDRKIGPDPITAAQVIALLKGSRCDHMNTLCRRKR